MKSFIFGFTIGAFLTFICLYITGLTDSNSSEEISIHYLEKSVSYENKKETSFKIFQVFEDAALATEVSDENYKSYYGNTVVLLGKDFYNDQIVIVKNPQRVGTYSYTNNGGRPMKVPVIK